MSKITFRADEELVDRVERLDGSKSEVMRAALRAYLDDRAETGDRRAAGGVPARERTLDDLLAARVDELLTDRLDELLTERATTTDEGGQDIDLTISLAGTDAAHVARHASDRDVPASHEEAAEPAAGDRGSSDAVAGTASGDDCGQCGTSLSDDHVYCPNCGEKATRRVFCECGDEIRTDWAFCPSCGRRTPAADVLDNP